MKRLRYIIYSVLILALASCGSSKETAVGDRYDSPNVEKPVKYDRRKVRKALVAEAMKWRGVRYRSGGVNHNGVDCSGLVMMVYRNVTGNKLPRNSAAQQKYVSSIKKKNLKPGDLVFFSINSKRVNHVGMYIGDGEIIHASGSRGVVISSLNEKYYIKHYHSSGRVKGID